jgi:hypothetical protein
MIGEFDVGGVFVPALVLWGVIAIGINMVLRQILTVVGFYRLVWHRGLFDLALLLILWALVTAVADRLGPFPMQIR